MKREDKGESIFSQHEKRESTLWKKRGKLTRAFRVPQQRGAYLYFSILKIEDSGLPKQKENKDTENCENEDRFSTKNRAGSSGVEEE